VLSNGSEVARFKYDPLGRRVERVAGTITTTWTYDGEDILREVSGTSTLKYVHGLGIDEPLAQEDGTGAPIYLHADGLGSVVKTTNSAGAIVASRRYDAFGNLELGAANGFAFTGREWDADAGLAYYRARYYDPKVGRFLSEDPIGLDGGVNLYEYVLSNPARWIDPLGFGAVAPTTPAPPPWPPAFCAVGSIGAPGCVPVPLLLPPPPPPTSGPSFCPVLPKRPCTPYFDRFAYWACLAYNGTKPSTSFPNALGGNVATAAGLTMQCIMAATFCLEGGMPPSIGTSGPPGPTQAYPFPRASPPRKGS
jgi:RHS repeat-associated protein